MSAKNWPPYELLDDRVEAAEARTRKLARIYHVSQEQAWDGRALLAELIQRHGGVHVRPEQQEALGKILSILLWGELAAWSISAELAEKLDDVDAKMAATSQVFDEARHFYVLRDYVRAAGITLPKLGGLSKKLLTEMLDTHDLARKLIGMQLLVENIALVLFKQIGDAKIEPVLTDLLPYYEKDEARHVGLGVLYLPKLMQGLGRVGRARMWLFQLEVNLLSLGSGLNLREDFHVLGLDPRAMTDYSFKLQRDVFRRIRQEDDRAEGGDGEEHTRAKAAEQGGDPKLKGMFRMSRQGQQRFTGFLHPGKPLEELEPTHRFFLGGLIKAAAATNRLFS